MSDISTTARIVRCDDLLEADINGELVGLHVDKGQCYGFNSVASRVWSLLSEPRSIDDLCSTLKDEFEVDETTCRAEVSELVQDLRSEGLVKLADA